ncbi:MAG: prolipoprotein diacylglyceryl transferase [Fimbriimonas sp.]
MIPVLFHIGNFPVRSFGVMILIAFLAGLWMVRRRAERYGFEVSKVTDLAFTALVAGVLGARILFIVQEIPYYRQHPEKLLTLQFEGLTSFGGVIFGAGAVLWWAWRHKAPLGRLFDLFGPAFMFGHVFGRIGCFLNGCCYGGVCDASIPWATKFHEVPGLHHPAQLYDALMNLVGAGLIFLWERKGNLRSGQAAGAFFILHGLTRFIYEFWRAGTPEQVRTGAASSTYWGNLPITEAQGVALALMLVGIVIFVIAIRKGKLAMPNPSSGNAPAEPPATGEIQPA